MDKWIKCHPHHNYRALNSYYAPHSGLRSFTPVNPSFLSALQQGAPGVGPFGIAGIGSESAQLTLVQSSTRCSLILLLVARVIGAQR